MKKVPLTPEQLSILAHHVINAIKEFPCPSDDPDADDSDESKLDEAIQFQNEERDAHLDIIIDGDDRLPDASELTEEIEMLTDYYIGVSEEAYTPDPSLVYSFGELVYSLHVEGLRYAVTVVPHDGPPGKYDIMAGERRVKAAHHLGWPTIKCNVHSVSEAGMGPMMESGREIPLTDLFPLGRCTTDLTPQDAGSLDPRLDGKSVIVYLKQPEGMVETLSGTLRFVSDQSMLHIIGDGETIPIKMAQVLTIRLSC